MSQGVKATSQNSHNHHRFPSFPPSLKRHCTFPLMFQPQHNAPPDDPTIAHAWYCNRACQHQIFKHPKQAPHFTPYPTQQILHTTRTPHHRSNQSHTARTPYALLNIKHFQNTPTANSDKHATQTSAQTIIQATHKRKQTTRARTLPAVTMTTPEFSPDTAVGVSRFVAVPSPSCADHKASQPHHKTRPATIARLMPPSLKRLCTCPSELYPQHNTPPDGPAIAHVCSCKRACHQCCFRVLYCGRGCCFFVQDNWGTLMNELTDANVEELMCARCMLLIV